MSVRLEIDVADNVTSLVGGHPDQAAIAGPLIHQRSVGMYWEPRLTWATL